MTFDAFATTVLEELELRPGRVTPATTFDDLALDSLQRAELRVVCDALGLDLPDDLFATLETLGDLFAYYEVKVLAVG